MDRLIYVITSEPLKINSTLSLDWPWKIKIVPSPVLLGIKEITLIHEGKVTAVAHASRDRSDLQDRSYTDFIWEFSQKDLQELI